MYFAFDNPTQDLEAARWFLRERAAEATVEFLDVAAVRVLEKARGKPRLRRCLRSHFLKMTAGESAVIWQWYRTTEREKALKMVANRFSAQAEQFEAELLVTRPPTIWNLRRIRARWKRMSVFLAFVLLPSLTIACPDRSPQLGIDLARTWLRGVRDDPAVFRKFLGSLHVRDSQIYAAAGWATSKHPMGRLARQAIDESRQSVLRELGGGAEDRLVFTSGATEANNLAIVGFAAANCRRGRHIVTTAIEHPSVLEPCRYLERHGFDVTYLPVDASGRVRVADLEAALRPTTILVSVMWANNETGVIQPLAEMANLCRHRGVVLHTDGASCPSIWRGRRWTCCPSAATRSTVRRALAG